MKTLKSRLVLGLVLLLILAGAAFVMWGTLVPSPRPEALGAMQSDSQVLVQTDRWLVFQPAQSDAEMGWIIYPGGRVDPVAYAPQARALASEGFLVVIVPMPLNLAIFAPDRAQEVMRAFPQVPRWVVGGHSLGGAMAARFAYRNPDAVAGLILWAAYPASTDDLSATRLPVLSIYGTRDGLASPEDIRARAHLLPSSTQWLPIEGGNHTQFAWLPDLPGDGVAGISLEAQQDQIQAATRAFFADLMRP